MSERPQTADSPRVFTIEPGDAFLPRLASALLKGDIIKGFGLNSGPLALSSATIFLPTRRAARSLRAEFARLIDQDGALLPDIRALGEFGDEALELAMADEAALDAAPLPPVGAERRLFALAPLVARWRERLPDHILARFEDGEPVVAPASPADALRLSQALCDLLDEAAREEADWTRLAPAMEAADVAGWFELTASFLSIVTQAWPDALMAMNRSDPARHLTAMIDGCTRLLAADATGRVVIAAGSTGSIPATARLLSTIARMPRGAVVLPGLDLGLREDVFRRLQSPQDDATLRGHPQYGLARLLQRMSVSRDAVKRLGAADEQRAARRTLVSDALLPVDDTGGWGGAGPVPAALNGIALMEAANEREEGLAVATAMRVALGDPGATVALVTPDRALARRVIAELKRFAIEADDSGGEDLAATAEGGFIPAIADAFLGEPGAAGLLAVIKHPLFRCGRDGAEMRRLAADFELLVLRGRKGRLRPFDLTGETQAALAFHKDKANRRTLIAFLTPELEAELPDFAAAMDRASSRLALRGAQPLSTWIAALAAVAEAFAADAGGDFSALYAGDAGADLARLLASLAQAADGFPVNAAEVPSVLAALMAGRMVKPRPGGHARAFIWGTLEARLQQADTLILGGLNEGGWPPAPDAGPFLARPMRSAIGLEPPERRIGQSAHDFEQAMGARHVILSRALKAGGAPSEPARWLQRLLAVAGPDGAQSLRKAGAQTLDLARRLDRPAVTLEAAPRPEPRPPLALRPKDFSVTEIDTLRRDPYAIHAKRILGLAPLPDLTRAPDAAERGTLFHAILAAHVKQDFDPDAPDAAAALLSLARRFFDDEALEPGLDAVWWPRFAALAPHIIAFEKQQKARSLKRMAEIASARHPVLPGHTLRARADRIDRLADGSMMVMDWKTGASPAQKAAQNLLSAQVALEAALVERGAFGPDAAGPVAELLFLRLKDKGGFKCETIAPRTTGAKDNKITVTPQEMAHEAWERLEGLLAIFDTATHPYLSRANPLKRRKDDDEEDYDHLARFAEWSATAGEEGDTEDDDDADGEAGET